MLSEVRSKCGVRGRTAQREPKPTTNKNENPKEVRPKRKATEERRGGLTSNS
jgi:hypothetical protein